MNRIAFLALALAGCNGAGGGYVEMPVVGSGVEPVAFSSNDGWSVELDRAEVAFGPFWACSTEVASPEFCPEAVLEMREAVVIDARSPDAQMLALASGRLGIAQTAMWDFGISWLPTAGAPAPLPAAPGGHSARFEGRASHPDGRALRFACDLDLAPQMRGSVAVRGRPVGPHEITSSDDAMLVAMDVRTWWRAVAFEQLFAEADASGNVVLEEGEPQYDTLRIAAQASGQPMITWAAE